MLFDLINWDKLRRAILYGLLIAAALILQTMIFSRVTVLGVRAMFLPLAAVAIGMFEGASWGGAFGLILGLFGDMTYTENTVLFTILFPCIGFFSGVLAEFLVNRRFFSYFFVCLGALALTAACQAFRPLIFHNAEILPLLRTALLQILWSVPFTPLLYFPCKRLAQRRLD